MGFLTDFTRDLLAVVGVVLSLIPIAASLVRYLSVSRHLPESPSPQVVPPPKPPPTPYRLDRQLLAVRRRSGRVQPPKPPPTPYWLDPEDRAFVVKVLVAALLVSLAVKWFGIRLPTPSTAAGICSAVTFLADIVQVTLVGVLLYDRSPTLRMALAKAMDERNGAANFWLACVSLPAFLLSLWSLSTLDETTPLLVVALFGPYLWSLLIWSFSGLLAGAFLAFPAIRGWL